MKWPWQLKQQNIPRTPSKRHPRFEQKLLVNAEQDHFLSTMLFAGVTCRRAKRMHKKGVFDHLDHPLFDFTLDDIEQAYANGWALDVYESSTHDKH